MGKDLLKNLQAHNWTQHTCKILISEVALPTAGKDRNHFNLKYSYNFLGKEYQSSRLAYVLNEKTSISELEEQASRYPVGEQVVCFVNPENPKEVVLEHGSLAAGWFILLPMLFMGVGLGGIYFLWALNDPDTAEGKITDMQNQIKTRNKKSGATGLFVMGLIFTFIGLIGTYFLGYRTLERTWEAASWIKISAMVQNARVKSHTGDDSTTYSADILYSYQHNGRTYRGDRVEFFGGSSSCYSCAADRVAKYGTGKEIDIYINPDNPHDSVIEREFSWFMLLGFIPLLFTLVGLLILKGGSTKSSSSSSSGLNSQEPGAVEVADWLPVIKTSANLKGPGLILAPAVSPLGKLGGALFFAVFWNGIVSVFVFQAVDSYRRGSPDIFLTLFLIPFVLIGLAVIALAIYQFFALWGPRPELILNESSFRPGKKVQIRWRLHGNTSKLKQLTFLLSGRQEITYRRGKNTNTEKKIFFEESIFKTPTGLSAGEFEFVIPDSMHSFETGSNKVIWELKMQGEIPGAPDLAEDFKIVILPARPL